MHHLPVIGAEPTPDELARRLAGEVEGEVRTGRHDRMLYATDASMYQVEPLAVLIPASVDDAVRAVRWCGGQGVPILPRGGGTSLAGQCTARAVVIDFSARCRAVRWIDAAARTCAVEPGVTIDDLNAQLAPHNLFFAPDPATTRQANIGGCIGNNAAGARSVRYGRTSDHVRAVDACLADGRRVRFDRGAAARDPAVRTISATVIDIVRAHDRLIRARFPRTLRRNAGYALDLVLAQLDAAPPGEDALDVVSLVPLLCGSEGTLAVTLGAELSLEPAPTARALTLVSFPDVDAAVDSVGAALQTGPSAVELLDSMVLEVARANLEHRHALALMPAIGGRAPEAVLYVEHEAAGSAAEAARALEDALRALESALPGRPMRRLTPGEAAAAWALRRAGEPLLHGIAGDRKPISFVEDNAVPPERLGEFVRAFRAIVQRHGTRAAFWAHASVGVLHVRPLLDPRDPRDEARLIEMAVEVADLARSLGGVMSGEHGDGRVRSPLVERYFGAELAAAFRAVKAAFDPRNLLNPGNIVEPRPIESITRLTRVRPDGGVVRAQEVDTYFDFSDQHGLGGAVEMCNGAGLCRKNSGGTMCPSYRATRDERHSTRGRANALRLAITGQLGAPAWTDADTRETLDLCLSCKACKSECPSNVDVARLKAEYSAQGFRESGRVPLRALAFGHVRALNRAGSLVPGLSNRAMEWGPTRALMGRVLGLAPGRRLPRLSRALHRSMPVWPIEASGRPAVGHGADSGAPIVALFADCFTAYNEPGIGLAAMRALEAFGYEVRLLDVGCCGRSMISTGLLASAQRTIDAAMEGLTEAARDPRLRAIAVCEPSCLSAIRDDWLQLKVRAPMESRRRIASLCALPEQVLDEGWASHPRRPTLALDRPVVLHAHCHQKALWGARTSAAMLGRVVGDRLTTPDTGCCGMAGSFGYTREHAALSMRIGELEVFPSVRAGAASGALVAATGTSCRHQIADGTGVRAVHPIEVVSMALGM